ncbi:hypothetical protein ACMA5I_13390 [Paracoccaceae bacterium GXU_MW_L88]
MKNRLHAAFAAISLGLLPSNVHSQDVQLDWLRTAGVACGGGLEIQAQGEIEAFLLKGLRAANVSGEGRYRQADVEALLKQFEDEERQPIYGQYVNCLLTLMQTANDVTGLPPREITLSSPIAVAELEIVSRGDRFVMGVGNTIALKDYSLIMSLDEVRNWNDKRRIDGVISDSQSGKNSHFSVNQGETIKLSDTCVLVPFSVDIEEQNASFISNC